MERRTIPQGALQSRRNFSIRCVCSIMVLMVKPVRTLQGNHSRASPVIEVQQAVQRRGGAVKRPALFVKGTTLESKRSIRKVIGQARSSLQFLMMTDARRIDEICFRRKVSIAKPRITRSSQKKAFKDSNCLTDATKMSNGTKDFRSHHS